MKKVNIYLAISIGLLAASSYLFWDSIHQQEQAQSLNQLDRQHAGKEMIQPQSTLRGEHDHAHAHAVHAAASLANPWQESPFHMGSSASSASSNTSTQMAGTLPEHEKEVVSAEELARRKKMAALGYMVPTDYYTKDLKTLRQLAQAGDAYAMVHLGEKYAFELNGQTTNPEFEQGVDYAKAAKQSFKDALVAGNIRSAGIIAELYFQEKNATEAYAWHLISDQLGDDISANWFRRTDMAQQATPAVKQAAQARAAQIMAELKLSKKST